MIRPTQFGDCNFTCLQHFSHKKTQTLLPLETLIEKPFHNSELGTFYSLVTSQESGLVVFRNDDFCLKASIE